MEALLVYGSGNIEDGFYTDADTKWNIPHVLLPGNTVEATAEFVGLLTAVIAVAEITANAMQTEETKRLKQILSFVKRVIDEHYVLVRLNTEESK